jgi:hypothetical protein
VFKLYKSNGRKWKTEEHWKQTYGKQKTPEALATNITFVHPYGAGYPQTYQGTIPGVIACKLSYNSIPLGGLEGAG